MDQKPRRNWRTIFVTIVLVGCGVIRLFEMWVNGNARLP